ncbi:MAG: hypothetical protein IJF78_12305 [Clostridia bacterium]|nr:hypothetical protein [Clostridia bacterium]
MRYTKEDIKSRFDSDYSNYIQGACFHEGRIYSVEGFSDRTNASGMQVIDPAAKTQYAAIDLWNIGLKIEPEFVDFHEGTLYYVDASGSSSSGHFAGPIRKCSIPQNCIKQKELTDHK